MQHQVVNCDRDWAHLPAVAVQAIGSHCCPASTAKLRLICSAWNQSLAAQFSTIHVGPGALTLADASTTSALQLLPVHVSAAMLGVCLHRAFPAVSKVDLTASSSREYPPAFVHDMTQLLARQPRIRCLVLREVHELDELDTLDPSSLWDVLVAALPLLAVQLQVLHVLGCFWNQPELFGSLRQLTAVTELRLSNTPLETAYELRVVASLTQLVTLEVGIIYDGSSAHHDVPRAVELLGDLQQLQTLSIPMWRRSLGGRAHPLATALSAALLRLTGLTNLAVDGKFSQLAVVSSLTNLQQLASAAPLSKEGWQAICHLPHLTLLTSLTPPLEVLQLNPQRPHMGCDLARLGPKASLAGLDVAVLSLDHLAPVAQFTSLQRLNLRCASTFPGQQQQSQILAVMASLPATLTSLSLGPMIPLCPELFSNIASSCSSGLRALHASFTHQAPTASHSGLSDSSSATFTSRNPGFGTAQQQQRVDDIMPWSNAQQQQLTVGEALGRLQQLWDLELVLLSDAERCESPMAVATAGRRSTSNGGLLGSPLSTWGPPAAGGNGAATLTGSDTQAVPSVAWSALASVPSPEVRNWGLCEDNISSSSKHGGRHTGLALVQLELLPRGLTSLKLEGNWLLTCSTPWHPHDVMVPVSETQLQQGQQQAVTAQQPLQQQERVCSVCKGTRRPGGSRIPTAEADSSSAAASSLCDCLQSLKLAGLLTGQPTSADVLQHPGHQQTPPPWPTAAAATFAGANYQPGRVTSSSTPGSPARGLLSGWKRPASPPAQHLLSGPQAAAADDEGPKTSGGTPPALELNTLLVHNELEASAGSGDQLGSRQHSLQKRTRSQTSTAIPAHVSLSSLPSRLGSSWHPQLAHQQQLVAQQQKADDADTLPQLPQLAELCLFRVQTSIPALAALVRASGALLRKLELLQLSVSGAEASNAASSHPESVQQRLQVLPGDQGLSDRTKGTGLPAGHRRGSFLTTEQLLHLPVSWSCLEELHIHPYHLWGMLASGSMCMGTTQHSGSAEPAHGLGPSSARSLQHVTQLVNLRHLYVVNVPVSFESASPAHAMIPPASAARVPSVSLPLHDMVAVKALLACLLAGLQQLPSLRQLLLYLGPVVGQASACHSIDEWCEAGEELLQALPHVRVRGFVVPQATTGWPTDGMVIDLGLALQGYHDMPGT